MNQHLLREASDAALYREQRDELVAMLTAIVDGAVELGPQATQRLVPKSLLSSANALVAKVSHD